jgi:putative endonuclease
VTSGKGANDRANSGKGARSRANSGDGAEALAASFLETRGLRILARNYRCRFGEIDLVAQSGATLVFVEVRARASDAFGGAAASITHAKRRKLVAAARYYMRCHGAREPACRFDVVLLTGAEPRIEWIENAIGE